VAEDSRWAREMAVRSVGETYQQDSTSLVDRFGVVGTPAECRARLNEYRDAGAQVAILALACPSDQASSMLEVVASEILPEFRPRPAIRSLAP
jgi:alkanesulfonate monooxygenase SsuD/methylene tetrahydromethanopterin reductase-like flavin-dependent oxidoreductase (luciferase family)